MDFVYRSNFAVKEFRVSQKISLVIFCVKKPILANVAFWFDITITFSRTGCNEDCFAWKKWWIYTFVSWILLQGSWQLSTFIVKGVQSRVGQNSSLGLETSQKLFKISRLCLVLVSEHHISLSSWSRKIIFQNSRYCFVSWKIV